MYFSTEQQMWWDKLISKLTQEQMAGVMTTAEPLNSFSP